MVSGSAAFGATSLANLLRRQGRVVLAAAACVLAAAPAWAHGQLESAQPAVDSTVSQSPQRVQIHFTERLEPKLASVSVRNAIGQRVDDGKPVVSPADSRILSIGLNPALPAGTYRVEWAITAVDTHRTKGQYNFTVKP